MKVYLSKHSNCSHPSLEVVVYLFLSLKGRQASILWSALCRFHWLYHCCHFLSLIAICCHSLSLVVIHCHSLSLFVPLFATHCHSFSLVVPLVVTRCHSLILVVTRCTTCLSFYKRSLFSILNDSFLRSSRREKTISFFKQLLFWRITTEQKRTYAVIHLRRKIVVQTIAITRSRSL